MILRTRIAAATLVSIVLHALVLSSPWFPAARLPREAPPLEARIASLPPPIAQPMPPPRAKARPRPAPAVQPEPAAPELARPQPDLVPEQPAPPAPASTPEPASATEPVASAAAEPRHEVLPLPALPRRGRIAYTLLYGEDRSYVGRARHSWEVDAGAYRLASEAETGGLVELFRPQRLRYLSEGKITAQGLRPETFLMSRARRGQNEAAQARFEWDSGSLVYGTAREQKSAPLAAGAHDLMSFIYQFAIAPPVPGRYRLAIATGLRFETYEIEVSAEEPIETPLGTLRALPVRQLPRPGQESLQFWLAADYRYLPVRIRHFDREGRFAGEQIVSEIRLSED